MTNQSPVWSGLIRGLVIAVVLSILTFLAVPGNDVAFGSFASFVVLIASTLDGIVEKYSGSTAFGSIKKS